MAIINDSELVKDSIKVLKEYVEENSGHLVNTELLTKHLTHDFYTNMVTEMYSAQEKLLWELGAEVIKSLDTIGSERLNEAICVTEPMQECLSTELPVLPPINPRIKRN